MTPADNGYWLLVGETPAGPFPLSVIHAKLAAGEASWETRACPVGAGVWLPLRLTPGVGPTAPELPDQAESAAARVGSNTRPEDVAAECPNTNCPACGSSLWTGSECGACGHGKAASGYRKRHPKPPTQEWTPGTILGAVAAGILGLGFTVWILVKTLAGLGEWWGGGKSRSFTENLKAGVVLVVVLGVLTWIWHKRQQKPQ